MGASPRAGDDTERGEEANVDSGKQIFTVLFSVSFTVLPIQASLKGVYALKNW
jgi:hypothetical protein